MGKVARALGAWLCLNEKDKKMKLSYLIIAALVTSSVLITGCATPAPVEYAKSTTLKSKEMLEDSEESQNYSRIRLVNVGARVYSIDQNIIGPMVNVETGELIHEAHVSPGRHDVLLETVRDYKSYGGYSFWKEARKEFSFDAKANHTYSFVAIPNGDDKVLFRMTDHGTDYDEKCADIVDTDTNSFKNYVEIKNGNLPIDCY